MVGVAEGAEAAVVCPQEELTVVSMVPPVVAPPGGTENNSHSIVGRGDRSGRTLFRDCSLNYFVVQCS